MLGMYANRANASWAEQQHQQQGWMAPGTVSESEQKIFQTVDDFKIYKADLVRKLRTGQVGTRG